ncbi:hypothetical protein LQ50_16075 [Halalkalibacter okhensis]|uniref:Uncharacterized protein n=1 Tax=Halalkalibacter okhensis TaxID=333138 RepID=A0A0B0ID51_9BACI|nr:hypothetical protein LQ50_16075 [Halalkalibacter okhensis]
MVKINISTPIFYLISATIVQFISQREVSWIQNISISLVMVLIMVLYNWSKIPYEWNKDKRLNKKDKV